MMSGYAAFKVNGKLYEWKKHRDLKEVDTDVMLARFEAPGMDNVSNNIGTHVFGSFGGDAGFNQRCSGPVLPRSDWTESDRSRSVRDRLRLVHGPQSGPALEVLSLESVQP
jgi:hypothetical protein